MSPLNNIYILYLNNMPREQIVHISAPIRRWLDCALKLLTIEQMFAKIRVKHVIPDDISTWTLGTFSEYPIIVRGQDPISEESKSHIKAILLGKKPLTLTLFYTLTKILGWPRGLQMLNRCNIVKELKKLKSWLY